MDNQNRAKHGIMLPSKIDLRRLLERSKSVLMTAAEIEEQRRSFAYGNLRIENERITRQLIDELAKKVKNTN